MLKARNRTRFKVRFFRTLLLLISLVTFQTPVSADIKDNIAGEYRAKGFAEHQKGNLNEALKYYNKAISLGLENPTVLNDLGILYEELGMKFKAEQFYIKAIQIDENYLPSYINLAYFYKQSGSRDKAFLYFKKRYDLSEAGDPWGERAKVEMLEINPGYRGRFLEIEAQRLSEELVVKAHQEFQKKVTRSAEHYARGEQYFQAENFHQAVNEYDKALSLTPENPKTLEARKKATLAIAKENIRQHSEGAIRSLELGDSISAKNEIQKMLTTIPKQ